MSAITKLYAQNIVPRERGRASWKQSRQSEHTSSILCPKIRELWCQAYIKKYRAYKNMYSNHKCSVASYLKRKLKQHPEIDVICNGQVISKKRTVTYLGVDLDQDLSGDHTSTKLIQQCNSRLKFLYHKSKFLNPHIRKQLCTALIPRRGDWTYRALGVCRGGFKIGTSLIILRQWNSGLVK